MSLRKGYIKNLSTKVSKSFMFNPTSYQYRRSASYTEVSAPGSPYPLFAFTKGEATSIPLRLFLSDVKATGTIPEHLAFLEGFLPAENPSALFSVPPIMLLSVGHLAKKCVMISMDANIQEYNKLGIPKIAEVILELKVVG